MRFSRSTAVILLAAIATGCVAPVPNELAAPLTPAQWQRSSAGSGVDNNWLDSFDDPALNHWVSRVLDNNQQLAQQSARVEQSWYQLAATRAVLLPRLSLELDGSRRRIGAGPQNNNFGGAAGGAPIDSFGLGLNISWQADIWGELSASARAAALTYAAAEAALTQTRRQLIADTVRAWFALAAAREQVAVAEQRATNAEQSLEVVDSGYRAGLNDALDLYLARNALAQEQANLADRRQQQWQAATNLQLLVADYPDGLPGVTPALLDIDSPIGFGVPGEVLSRRADLQQAWLALLASNADLAVAHKQRFPSLTIAGSLSDSDGRFRGAIDGTPLAWSLLGSITQPLFEGGRLKANQQRAAARVAELEQRYLELVNAAFAEVENAISQRDALSARYTASRSALDNAEAALDLALQQYQRGIVAYTTVLESQRRAFDARATLTQLQNLKLQNRIDLYQALGGAFGEADIMEARL